MTASDGTPNNRTRQAADCAAALKVRPEAFGPRRVYDSGVGILYNPTCDKWCDLIMPEEKGLYRRSLAGWYRFLWKRNINPAIVQPSDLSSDYWGHLKVLVAPMLAMVSRQDAAALEAFIASGGKILADSRFAIVDENGIAHEHSPGGLVERFGCEEIDFLSPYGDVELCSGGRFSVMKLAGATAAAQTSLGDVAAARTDQSLYLATPFGLDTAKPRLARLVDDFLDSSIDRTCRVLQQGEQVDVTISHSQDPANRRCVLVCVTNYAQEPARICIRIDAIGTVTSLWPNVAHCTKPDGDGQIIEFTVPARGAAGFVV